MKDEFVRLRKFLERRHMFVSRKIKTLSSDLIKCATSELRQELHAAEGERNGLCYALKALDKACQTKMELIG